MPKIGECCANARISQQTCYAVTVSDSSTCYPGPTGSLRLSQGGLQTHIVKCKFPPEKH